MEDEENNGELFSEAHSEGQSRDWEMVEENRNNNSNQEEEEDANLSVFPPSHHEGLHSEGQSTLSPPLSPPPLNVNGQRPSHHRYRESLDSWLRIARDVVMKRLKLGIEIVSSKIFRVVSLARSGSANSLFVPVAGVTVAFVVSYWFLKWQRLRRQGSQEAKIDQLLNLVRHQDEKITMLLDHISRLNEILSTRRRISIFRSG